MMMIKRFNEFSFVRNRPPTHQIQSFDDDGGDGGLIVYEYSLWVQCSLYLCYYGYTCPFTQHTHTHSNTSSRAQRTCTQTGFIENNSEKNEQQYQKEKKTASGSSSSNSSTTKSKSHTLLWLKFSGGSLYSRFCLRMADFVFILTNICNLLSLASSNRAGMHTRKIHMIRNEFAILYRMFWMHLFIEINAEQAYQTLANNLLKHDPPLTFYFQSLFGAVAYTDQRAYTIHARTQHPYDSYTCI